MFVCHRYNNTDTAYQYICGLIQSDRRNIERMEENVVESDYETLQQFISSSPWDARAVINKVAVESDRLIGGTGRTGLLLDETSFIKKGKCSVGVARQWSGRLGKTENSQIAVFAALCAGDRVIPVDTELFLPNEWTDDKKRCREAGVPEDRFDYKTKPELAVEIVLRQRKLGVRFDYVCADGLYGNSPTFCRALEDASEIFLVHVHSDQRVYQQDPQPMIPERISNKGRKPTKLQAQCEPIRVDDLFKSLNDDDLVRIKVRDTTTGSLEVYAYRCKVWVWDGEEDEARIWTLYIRRDSQSPDEIRYCLTNTVDGTPTSVLAEMEAQRYWVERAFEDAKGQAGMAEYQVRGWNAWYHHMALVMMAMLFMTKNKMLYQDQIPLLTCYDIKVLLAYFLPNRKNSVDEIIRQMELRHAKRRAASESATKRQTPL
ncbi:MAG: IS701 family transposase [Desulfobacterales bacterium]|nr:IS701 family transposase [Desulfobacterales bacterium]